MQPARTYTHTEWSHNTPTEYDRSDEQLPLHDCTFFARLQRAGLASLHARVPKSTHALRCRYVDTSRRPEQAPALERLRNEVGLGVGRSLVAHMRLDMHPDMLVPRLEEP